jgi:anti-sigma factor RsiW
MTRLFNPCRKCRENICALLSGDLPAADRAEAANHLAACADCRTYRDQIGSMTAVLGASDELFSDIKLSEATQMRWAREFESATEPTRSIAARIVLNFLDWTRDMIWPCRRIWAGLAAIWIVILGLDASQRVDDQARASRAPSPEIMRALLAREGFVPGPNRPSKERSAEPSRQSSPPRSERGRESKPSGA